MDNPELLVVSHLVCHYGSRTVVEDVSFELPRGRILALLGPNGAGKTTTMHALCGVRGPSSGTVTIEGHDVYRSAAEGRSRIGYLPEHPPLYPELTVLEYLQFCARLRQLPRRERGPAVARALEACGLTDVRGRVIARLSKGFQQRVGIAQAVVHRPALLVLDEPTVGLDPHQIHEIRALVRELGREQGVVLSTHVLAEVDAVCDRVVVLNEGRVVLCADLAELAADAGQCLRASWAETPAIGEVRALEGVVDAVPAGAQGLEIACSDRDLATRSILRASLERGWTLRELTGGGRSLEATFLALTHGDPAPTPAVR